MKLLFFVRFLANLVVFLFLLPVFCTSAAIAFTVIAFTDVVSDLYQDFREKLEEL